VPGDPHGEVGLELVPVCVDRVGPLEDGDPFPKGDGRAECEAGVLNGEGTGYVDDLSKGVDVRRGDVGEDGGHWLVTGKLSVRPVEESVARVSGVGLLDGGRVDGIRGTGAEEAGVVLVVAAGLVCEYEGALDGEGDAVFDVIIVLVVVVVVGWPTLWGGVGGDAGGAGVVLGAASGDTSAHSWVWATSCGGVGVVAGGGRFLRHCGCFVGCDVGESKVGVFGRSGSPRYIPVYPLPRAPVVVGLVVRAWPVWPGAA
jgi:hypothetical protein